MSKVARHGVAMSQAAMPQVAGPGAASLPITSRPALRERSVGTALRHLIALACSLILASAALASQDTARKAGCLGCHALEKKTIGPSIKDIAAKYTGDDVEALLSTVKAGRTAEELTWGSIPMPASPADAADVRSAIEWMLEQ